MTSQQYIRVVRDNGDHDTNASDDFEFVPIVKQVPTGLWSPIASPTSKPNPNSDRMIDALTGYALHPAKPPQPGASSYIKDANLRYEVIPRDLAPDKTATVTYTPTANENALTTSFTDPDTTRNRAELLSTLGFDPTLAVDLTDSLLDAFVLPPQVVTSSQTS